MSETLRNRILAAARRWPDDEEAAVASLMPPEEGFDRALDDAADALSDILGDSADTFVGDLYAHACFSEQAYSVPGIPIPLNVRTSLVFLPVTAFVGAMRQSLADTADLQDLASDFQAALPSYGLGPSQATLLPGSVTLQSLFAAGPERLSRAIRATEVGRDPQTPASLTRLPDAAASAAVMRALGGAKRIPGNPTHLESRCLVFVVLQSDMPPEAEDGGVEEAEDAWIARAQARMPLLLFGRPSDPHVAVQGMAIGLVRGALTMEAAMRKIPPGFPASRYHVHRHADGIEVALEYGSTLLGPAHLSAAYAARLLDPLVRDLARDGVPIVRHEASFHKVQSRRGRLS